MECEVRFFGAVSTATGSLPSFLGVPPDTAGAAVPPDAVTIEADPSGEGRVVAVAFQSGRYLTEVVVDGHRMVGWTTQRLEQGAEVTVAVDPATVVHFAD